MLPRHLRKRAVCLEILEQRLAPATSLYVTTPMATTLGTMIREYSSTGQLVRTINVPVTGEIGRDLVVDNRQIHLFNGTFSPNLSTYDAATASWSNTTTPGWSTVNNLSYGGIARTGGATFVTDMNTSGAVETGIVRFNADGSVDRFATDFEPIDLTVGLDGKLYALNASRTLRVYQPDTMALLQTVTLPTTVNVTISGTTTAVTQDYRSIAVDQNGLIYAADWGGVVSRFSATGVVQTSQKMTTAQGPAWGNLIDIDIFSPILPIDGGQLVVGSSNGTVGYISSNNLLARTTFSAGSGAVFVTAGPALAELSIADATVNEATDANTTASFTVTLSGPLGVPVSVNWVTSSGTSNGGALAGSDFVNANGMLTFAPGETSKTIDITILGDRNDELDETFTVNLISPGGTSSNATLIDSSGLGRILDDDAAPNQSIYTPVTAGNATDYPRDGTFDQLVTTTGSLFIRNFTTENLSYRPVMEYNLSGADLAANPIASLDLYLEWPFYSSSGLTVYAFAGDGQATVADANNLSGIQLGRISSVTEASAWRRLRFDSSILAPLLAQSNYIGITVVADTNTTVDIRGTASAQPPRLSLWSSEPPVVPTLNIFQSSVTETNPGAPTRWMNFTVQMTLPTTQPVTVDYFTDPSNAIAGVDYVSTAGTLTFQPGELVKTISVEILPDTIYEPTEYFYVKLANPTTAGMYYLAGTGSINNDDAIPSVLIGSIEVTEPDAGQTGSAVYTVTLSSLTYQTVNVFYTTKVASAAPGEDYTSVSGVLTFAPGEISKTISVPLLGDNTDELDETFYLEVTQIQNGTYGSNNVPARILDNDPTPTVNVSSQSIIEGDTGSQTLVFNVTLTNPSSFPINVDYVTADGTAKAGSDYGSLSGRITFLPGEVAQTVSVTVYGDLTHEASETFQLRLLGSSNSVLGLSGVGTISNDDSPPTPSVTGGSVVEGNDGTRTIDFVVSLSNPSYLPIRYTLDTNPVSATPDVDYTPVYLDLTFVPGETSKVISVPILGDTITEGDETFTVDLIAPLGALLLSATGTIVNDDAAPTLSVSSPSVVEGDSGSVSLVYTVSLSNPSAFPVTVDFATADGTAIAGSDYLAKTGTLTFAPGVLSQDVVVTVLGDLTYELAETLSLVLSGAVNGVAGSPGVGTISNDDGIPTVTLVGGSVAEGDSGITSLNFVVTLSNPSYLPITYTFDTVAGSATEGVDYLGIHGPITFAPGQTGQVVTVSIVGDGLLEPTESFSVTLSDAGSAVASATGTILLDDYAPIAEAGANLTGNEGQTFAFNGSASSDADGDTLTFTWNFGDGTTGTGVAPSYAYADNGVYVVTLTVSDGQGGVATDTLTVTVNNVAPTASVTGDTSGVPGQARAFTFRAIDPSSVDQAAPFTYRVTWSDGVSETRTGSGAGISSSRTFLATGNYTVRVNATDRNGAQGPEALLNVAIVTAQLQGSDLVVGGSNGVDTIVVRPANTSGAVTVMLNNATVGTFTPTGSIVVRSLGGNDSITLSTTRIGNRSYAVSQRLYLFGGAGNDNINASAATGASVLLGEDGTDTLTSGTGRNILIGGTGADILSAGDGDDILVASATSHDGNLTALDALLDEWDRTDSTFEQRRDRLLGTLAGGLNGGFLLNTSTVSDDGAIDDLTGGNGRDWFFASLSDRLRDRKSNETITR
ncbi:MAG: Calx-beta domain-containing protein [Gemmataceae bacterium]